MRPRMRVVLAFRGGTWRCQKLFLLVPLVGPIFPGAQRIDLFYEVNAILEFTK